MTTHRSWFPFILVGLSTALLALIVAVYDPSATPSSNDAQEVTAPTPTEYEDAVRAIVMTYMASSGAHEVSAQTAYDALLALRVPSMSYQDAHIQLVLAFGQIAAGETDAGQARLSVVEEANPWIFGL